MYPRFKRDFDGLDGFCVGCRHTNLLSDQSKTGNLVCVVYVCVSEKIAPRIRLDVDAVRMHFVTAHVKVCVCALARIVSLSSE